MSVLGGEREVEPRAWRHNMLARENASKLQSASSAKSLTLIRRTYGSHAVSRVRTQSPVYHVTVGLLVISKGADTQL
jgi:hypothetical protein